MSVHTDPIELAIFKSAFHSIAEEMGAVLRRTSFSPNIKERRDYSSAIFDDAGNIIAMGDDMPVHLGSMPMSVRAALDAFTLEAGDVAISISMIIRVSRGKTSGEPPVVGSGEQTPDPACALESPTKVPPPR